MSRRGWLVGAALLVSAIAVACGSTTDDSTTAVIADDSTTAATTGGATRATVAATAEPAAEAPIDLSDINRPLTSGEERFQRRHGLRFTTDFTIRSIDLTELLSGGPGKDGIPSIDDPKFITQAEAGEYMAAEEPVIALEINGEARAYPIQILIWHEIANDTLGGVPVTVTFCPLCNTAIVFDRRVDGEVREFGVSGLLRRSDLIMFDRTNESFWQQITGEAIVGVDTGKRLTFLPSQIVSWQDFTQAFPDALVLSRNTGSMRAYGSNPYGGYDRVGSSTMFPVNEFGDVRLDAKERVLTVEIDGDAVAFPFSALTEHVVLETEVAEQLVVAFWQEGTVSPLDQSFIIGSANVGAAGAFSPFVDGERLSFEARGDEIVDAGTGSVWSVLGRAISGPLEGTQLEPVLSANHFWFAWSVFNPETRVILAPQTVNNPRTSD